MSELHQRRTACRACDTEPLAPFIELGPQPLANSFLTDLEKEAATEPKFPLDVALCRKCGLVQILDVVDPEFLFRDYIYVTGTSDTIAVHNQKYAAAVKDALSLSADDLVVEVASNDGSLLLEFQKLGVKTLGVEPARNIAKTARERGVETIEDFFDSTVGPRLKEERGPARAVIGNNVLAHVDTPRDFLQGAAALIGPGGRVVVEVPYIEEFVERNEYDTVYHEHHSYFSVAALMHLFEAAGLTLQKVDRVPVHGGSIRVWAGHADEAPHAPAVVLMAEEEKKRGYTSFERYQRFANEVKAQRSAMNGLLRDLKTAGHSVVGYGAPAKGNTMLNYCGIDASLVAYTVDKNPLKVGKYTPGSHLLVRPPEVLVEEQPDYVLILAWNFAEEIMRQQDAYRKAGGKFIIPIPKPEVVS